MEAGIDAMIDVRNWELSTWFPEIGHYWDANEQLAQMYLIRNQDGDVDLALEAYETANELHPNRYHPLAGAGYCAELIGDTVKANFYYSSLLTLTSEPFPQVQLYGLESWDCPTPSPSRRPEMEQAESFIYSSSSDGGNDGIDFFIFIGVLVGLGLIIISLVVINYANYKSLFCSKYSDYQNLRLKEKLSDSDG